SQCANGAPFARYWLHNGYLMVEGEKMSKSLGNFFTVRELLDQAPGEAIRLCMLSTHYHQPFDWTAEGLRQARATLDRLYTALRATADVPVETAEAPLDVVAALKDDLNTPLAIAHLHELATQINKATDAATKATAKAALLAAGDLLGVLRQDPEAWFRWQPANAASGLSDGDIDALIQARADARKAKNFAEADRVRKELADNGVVLEDGPQGTSWKRV
ncbi:MAG TPA: DALR domain-containing protein, partial [Magnetospirillum sp.]|nr:DALR domain-containing protein [Magnetospirillum sp.]